MGQGAFYSGRYFIRSLHSPTSCGWPPAWIYTALCAHTHFNPPASICIHNTIPQAGTMFEAAFHVSSYLCLFDQKCILLCIIGIRLESLIPTYITTINIKWVLETHNSQFKTELFLPFCLYNVQHHMKDICFAMTDLICCLFLSLW